MVEHNVVNLMWKNNILAAAMEIWRSCVPTDFESY